MDVTDDTDEAETSDAGSRGDRVEDEAAMDAETAEERGEVAEEEEEKGVGMEVVDDACAADCIGLLPKPLHGLARALGCLRLHLIYLFALCQNQRRCRRSSERHHQVAIG